MSASRQDIVLAYRHLYQHSLRAVQYAKPARYIVRDKLRNAFRGPSPKPYDPSIISNTLLFLDNAAKSRGLEHFILKNLLFVHWGRQKLKAVDGRKSDAAIRRKAYVQFDRTVANLNATMGICLT